MTAARSSSTVPAKPTVVLACASEDATAMTKVLRRLVERGVRVDVVAGVELDVRPFEDAVARATSNTMYVLCRSEDLDAFQVDRLRTAARNARISSDHLVLVPFDPELPIDFAETVLRHLAEAGRVVRRVTRELPPVPTVGSRRTTAADLRIAGVATRVVARAPLPTVKPSVVSPISARPLVAAPSVTTPSVAVPSLATPNVIAPAVATPNVAVPLSQRGAVASTETPTTAPPKAPPARILAAPTLAAPVLAPPMLERGPAVPTSIAIDDSFFHLLDPTPKPAPVVAAEPAPIVAAKPAPVAAAKPAPVATPKPIATPKTIAQLHPLAMTAPVAPPKPATPRRATMAATPAALAAPRPAAIVAPARVSVAPTRAHEPAPSIEPAFDEEVTQVMPRRATLAMPTPTPPPRVATPEPIPAPASATVETPAAIPELPPPTTPVALARLALVRVPAGARIATPTVDTAITLADLHAPRPMPTPWAAFPPPTAPTREPSTASLTLSDALGDTLGDAFPLRRVSAKRAGIALAIAASAVAAIVGLGSASSTNTLAPFATAVTPVAVARGAATTTPSIDAATREALPAAAPGPVLAALEARTIRALDGVFVSIAKTATLRRKAATVHCRNLVVAGLKHWRLPSSEEIAQLGEAGFVAPDSSWWRGGKKVRTPRVEWNGTRVKATRANKKTVARTLCVHSVSR